MRGSLRRALLAVLAVGSLGAGPLSAAPLPVRAAAPAPAVFRVGAAVESIDPNTAVYSGGFGASPAITATYAPLQVRAIYVSNGRHAVAMAVVDSQAWFAAYQEGASYGITYARQQAALQISRLVGPAMAASDVIVQGTHSHSAATLEGIWGPVPPKYLRLVTDQTVNALRSAALQAKPALLQYGSVQAPDLDNVITAQTDSYAGWSQDGQVSVLRALDPQSGATLATFANVPAHPDIVNGASWARLGADYFGDVRDSLQRLLGGTAVVGPATLGREETFVQVGGVEQMHWFARVVTNRVTEALAQARYVTDATVSSSELPVAVPGTNPLLLALVAANHLPDDQKQQMFQQTGEYPIDRADTPPYLNGTVIGTYLTSLRIGPLAYVSMPGESFPEVRNAIVNATAGAAMIVALNKGQDDWGYYYPAWVTPFTEVYHSDHLEYNVGATAGDQIIETQLLNLQTLGFSTTPGLGTPMQTDWQQALRPGVQGLAAPGSGDAGSDGRFTTAVQAAFSEAAYNGAPLKGLVHWDFGDGTVANTHAVRDGSPSGPTLAFPHSFGVGRWTVTLSAVDGSGNSSSWRMPVTVYPSLLPSVEARHRTDRTFSFTAGAEGGDGALLAAHWSFSDGATAEGLRVTHTFAPGVAERATVTVVDGTDSTATTTWPGAAPSRHGHVATVGLPMTAAAVGGGPVPSGAGVYAPLTGLAVSAQPGARTTAAAGALADVGGRVPMAALLMAALLLARRLLLRRRRRPEATRATRP